MKQRERAKQLIELGGPAKAGIVGLTENDRAVFFGALLGIAYTLWGEQSQQALLFGKSR